VSKQTVAIVAFIVSSVLWLAVFLVPFIDASAETKWLAAAVLYGVSNVIFFGAVALIGKDAYALLKEQVRARFRPAAPDPAPPSPPGPPSSSSGPATST
jgi:hypothetical protein